MKAVADDKSEGVVMQKSLEFAEVIISRTVWLRLLRSSRPTATNTLRNNYWGRDNCSRCRAQSQCRVRNLLLLVNWLWLIVRLIASDPTNEWLENFRSEKMAFNLRRVKPIFSNGTPRLNVLIDRVSKTLVETLLKSQFWPIAEKIPFRSAKRFVGHKSIILTTKRIPQAAIIAVDSSDWKNGYRRTRASSNARTMRQRDYKGSLI